MVGAGSEHLRKVRFTERIVLHGSMSCMLRRVILDFQYGRRELGRELAYDGTLYGPNSRGMHGLSDKPIYLESIQ